MSTVYELESREPVSSEFAFDTFSKSGFKPISSICEIIDNSIEANSTEILIKFDWGQEKPGRAYRRVQKFVFIDDGYGMDQSRIYDYFVATAGDKRNNKEGIGKFGVGAYMSGISQAKRCEVYSKTRGGTWLYTNLIEGGNIPKPIAKNPPNEHVKHEYGTIVIWSDTYSTFTENDVDDEETGDNLVFQLGRIYRKFLTDQKLVNGKLVTNTNKVKLQIESGSGNIIDIQPYDPTFLTFNPKQGDKKPRLVYEKIKLITPEHQGEMHIVYSFFPEEWWIKPGKPGLLDENRKERKIIQSGISLVREGRELYYGSYPGGPIKIDGTIEGEGYLSDIDRWVGIEVSFNRDSDEIFGVEFNKTRIIMEKFARTKISEVISPTINSQRRIYHSRRLEYKAEIGDTDTDSDSEGTTRIHGVIPTPEYTSEEEKKLKEFAERYKDDQESIEDVYQDLLKGYHVSLKYKLSSSGPFVEFAYEGDSVLVMYNMQHPFMIQFFETLEQMGQKLGAEPGKANSIPELGSVRALLDILLASYGFTRTTFRDILKPQIIEQTLNQLTTNWGNSANTLAREKL